MTKKEKKKKAFENYVEEERNEKAWLGFMDGYDAGYKDAQNEWIDVGTKKPNKNGKYLCYTCDDRVLEGFNYDGFFEVADYWDDPVLYWQPLPKPPKKD